MDDLLCKPSGPCGQALRVDTQVPDFDHRVHRLLLLRTNRIKEETDIKISYTNQTAWVTPSKPEKMTDLSNHRRFLHK